MQISIYKEITDVTPKFKSISVYNVLKMIKDGHYKNQVKDIRLETEKKKRNLLKQKIENVTFCGIFSTRANANLKQHSGLACLDFDDVNELDDLKNEVNSDTYTFASFISPSGNGIKVLVKIPLVDNNDDYLDYYIKLIEHYSKYWKLDEGTKDIARATYLSYDPDLFLNDDSEIFTDKFQKPLPIQNKIVNIPITNGNEIADRLDKWFQKRWNSVNRNNNLHAYARQMNAFGVDKNICDEYLLRYGEPSKKREILSLIKSAYKHSNEFGSQKFEDTELVKKVKNLVLSGETFDNIKRKIEDVNPEKLEIEVKKHADELKTDEFWFYTDKNAIRLASFRFLNYLESNNIFKYYPDKYSSTYLFVKKENNFLSIFDENKIKDFTLTDLRNRGIIDAFELMADNSQAFSPRYLSMIKTIDVKFNRDSFNASYIYYKNVVIKTTADNIQVLKYDEIPDIIWENQIIDREIELKNESEGVFKTFIWRISGEDAERYYTLKSVIGYLMHSYQNDAKPKAIIFNDEMLSDDIPNGGSGKGLIHKAIGHIKSIVVEDGKKFDPRGQFAYQKANKDTQIFLLDDVSKNFNFESLFSIITEGMTIEKKGQDAFQIPFKESPKISITTNYTVKGSGASFYRRVFEVEIANHFNENHTPEDEFNHQFFSDWDDDEWQRFDNFMIRCIQFYLKNGLVESRKVNLALRKLKNDLGAEFIEFMESHNFDGTHINKKEFRDDFNKNYHHVSKFNTPQKFNKKIKDYCEYYKLEFSESKYNGLATFRIIKNKEEEDEFEF